MNWNITPLLIVACLALFATGCNPDGSAGRRGESGSPQTGLPTTTVTLGKQTFTLEIAATDKSREIGLMYRDDMPADHGMIFVFPQERSLTFWMKHTRLPLDIVYLDKDGRVVSVHQMQPFDLSPIAARGPAKYAIELNQGAAAAAGVKDGDQVKLPPDITSITAEESR